MEGSRPASSALFLTILATALSEKSLRTFPDFESLLNIFPSATSDISSQSARAFAALPIMGTVKPFPYWSVLDLLIIKEYPSLFVESDLVRSSKHAEDTSERLLPPLAKAKSRTALSLIPKMLSSQVFIMVSSISRVAAFFFVVLNPLLTAALLALERRNQTSPDLHGFVRPRISCAEDMDAILLVIVLMECGPDLAFMPESIRTDSTSGSRPMR